MTPRSRSLFYVLLLSVMLTVSGCSAIGGTGKDQPTPTPIPPPPIPEKPTYTVQRGTVVDSLSFTGRVAPAIEEELFFRTSGRVKVVYVERNEFVEADTILAELENDDLLRQLQQSNIELETADLNLRLAQEARQFQVDKAQINLEIRRLQLDRAEEQLKGLQNEVSVAKINLKRATQGPTAADLAIAEAELGQIRNNLWSAQLRRDSTCGKGKGVDCDSAQATVQAAEDSVRIKEIKIQELKKALSPDDLIILQADYDGVVQRRNTAQIDIAIQKHNITLAEMELQNLVEDIDPQLLKAVERAKLSVERLEAQVINTRVLSPISGKVTSVSAYEGREIQAYRNAFVVADEKEIEVTAEPMSSQLQRLAEGMDAAIILSAYPGKELPAEIMQLPYPYGKGGGATVEEADKLTHISFDPLDLDLEAGDLVKVIVTLERKDDALWLPPAAIRTFAGRQFVVVEEEGRQRRVDVTLGIESTARVEILDGLEEGLVVVGQ